MSFLYILKNNKDKYYTGITALLPEKRLEKHNKGGVASTRNSRPWQIVYIEEFGLLADARAAEKKIKSWKSGNAFKKFLSKTAGSSNGRTVAFEAIYLGSNPSPAALERNDKFLPRQRRGEAW